MPSVDLCSVMNNTKIKLRLGFLVERFLQMCGKSASFLDASTSIMYSVKKITIILTTMEKMKKKNEKRKVKFVRRENVTLHLSFASLMKVNSKCL